MTLMMPAGAQASQQLSVVVDVVHMFCDHMTIDLARVAGLSGVQKGALQLH